MACGISVCPILSHDSFMFCVRCTLLANVPIRPDSFSHARLRKKWTCTKLFRRAACEPRVSGRVVAQGRYWCVMYTLDTRLTLVWQVGMRSHMIWTRLENVTHTISTRWWVTFETLDTRLRHASRWLTSTHVRFWTCWWISHTIFTRSCHTSMCDCALNNYQWN